MGAPKAGDPSVPDGPREGASEGPRENEGRVEGGPSWGAPGGPRGKEGSAEEEAPKAEWRGNSLSCDRESFKFASSACAVASIAWLADSVCLKL